MATDPPDSATLKAIADRQELALALTRLRERAAVSIRDLARQIDYPHTTVAGYLNARHLPPTGRTEVFDAMIVALGDGDRLPEWHAALDRVRHVSDGRAKSRVAPYRGLEPFHTDDASVFFGREDVVAELLARLGHRPGRAPAGRGTWLALIGPSGSGKSSVLQAGLVAAVDGNGEDDEAVSLLTPGLYPMNSLNSIPPDTRLLIVDQFEELFAPGVSTHTAAAFVASLDRLTSGGTDVIIAMRADFYSAALNIARLAEVLRTDQVLLAPMSLDQLRAAIVKPAEAGGVSVDPALVELLLAELAPASTESGDAGALPLLSHALLSTWQHASANQLTVADYAATGGLHGAIQQSAEAVYADLDPTQRGLARRLFLRLTNVESPIAATRRAVRFGELESLTDHAELSVVIEAFVAQRLLTVDEDSVQVAHEMLLSAWPRLREWLADDLAGTRVHRRLTRAANDWADNHRDTALLSRGTPLESIDEWASDPDHQDDLNNTEREFLHASLISRDQLRARERRRAGNLRGLAAVAAVLALLAGTLAVFSITALHSADRARHRAEQTGNDALSRQLAIEATQLRAAQPALAAQLSLAAYRISATPQARSALLDSTAGGDQSRLLPPSGSVQAAAVNPAGTLLAATGGDNRVHLWPMRGTHVPSGAGVALGPAQTDTLFAVAFVPDSTLLIDAGAGGRVQAWDVGDPAAPRHGGSLIGPASTVYCLATNADGSLIAAGTAGGRVYLWAHADGRFRLLRTLSTGPGSVHALGWDGDVLVAGVATATAGSVHAWRIGAGGARSAGNADLPSPVLGVAVHDDLIVAGTKSGAVTRLRTDETGITRLGGKVLFQSWVNAIGFSGDGRYYAAGSSDAGVTVFDTATGTPVNDITAAGAVTSLSVTPDGQRLVIATNGGEVQLQPLLHPLAGLSGRVFSVSYARSGETLIAASGNNRAALWNGDPPGGVPSSEVDGPAAAELDGAAAISPDGRMLAAGSLAGPVALWTLPISGPPTVLPGPTGVDEAVAFSSDSSMLAVGSDDGTAHLWDVSDPAHPRSLPTARAGANYVMGLSFSPDGRHLAVAEASGTLQIWSTDPVVQRSVAKVTDGQVLCTAWSADGTTVIAGASDRKVYRYDVADPARPRQLGDPLTGPTDQVFALSRMGDLVAAASADGTVWIYDIATPSAPSLYATLLAGRPTGTLFSVSADRSGRLLAASGTDGRVFQWDMDLDRDARWVCATAGASITRGEWSLYVPGVPYAPPCA